MNAMGTKRTIRSFLVIGFSIGITSTAALSAIMGLLLFRSQLSSTAALIKQRVESSITLNRNEILNEIALNDQEAIREHLGILRSDLNLDRITLRFGTTEVSSDNEAPGLHHFVHVLVPKDALKPLLIPLASDYGGFKAEMEVRYRDEVIRRIIRPVLVPFAVTLLCLLLVEFLLFFVTFQLINYKVIRPIQDLASSFKIAALAQNGISVPALDVQRGQLSELEDLNESLRSYSELRESALAGEIARQVAHDIRSPLAALEVVSGDAGQLPADQRMLIHAAVGRIRDIANSLLRRTRPSRERAEEEAIASHLLSSLIEPIMSEKALQFRLRAGVVIDAGSDAYAYGIFARLQPVEFGRLMSNLLNNAVESLGSGGGTVRVRLAASGGRAVVSVQDTGGGISPEVLSRLGRRGETHGKSGGSGLGLYHARTCAESWGGGIEIDSEVGKGTEVRLLLPQAPVPDWFASELVFLPRRAVLILDDDPGIHQVWRHRFDALQSGRCAVKIVNVFAPDEIREWVIANPAAARDAAFLLDYELAGFLETGLSLTEELGVRERTVLVTSRHDEPDVQEGCRRLGIRMLPKPLAGLVPMRMQGDSPPAGSGLELWDAVLIDDDELARATWKIAALRFGKSLRAFSTAAEFFEESHAIDRGTPIYIDAELGDGVKGGVEALRIHELGFGSIYLATGHEAEKFAGLAHLRGVVGKTPPWGRGA